MDETQKERQLKAGRLVELDELIAAAEPGAAKRWLMLEQAYYQRGYAFASWPEFCATLKANEAQMATAERERQKTAEQRAAEAQEAAAAKDAAERAEWERENDPFILARRARASRTF